jgi:hypothetical protein
MEPRVIFRRQADKDMVAFTTCPKYDKHELSEDQILEIAKKAVVMARDEFYTEVGRGVTSKFFVVTGVITVGLMGWLSSHGYLK